MNNTTEVVAETQRFGELGLDMEIEDGVVCCHAEQDKVWVEDPSGTRWEVYTITDDLPEASYASRAANLIPLTGVTAGASSIEDCCADGGLCVG